MTAQDSSQQLQARVVEAAARGTPLAIRGGGSKAFYGRAVAGEPLDVTGHCGVVGYEPSELVITARAGTPLAEIETLLAQNKQMLPFEPPHFGEAATVGGMVAAGLSGPARPWFGAVRDAVLGVKLLNGKGEILNFGGQVMKNVAGYDVSRLMAGSLGTLGVILEVSLKVLPRPVRELSLAFELDTIQAAKKLAGWGRQPLPLSASLHHDGRLFLRLSGTPHGVASAHAIIGGEETQAVIWDEVREQRLPFFAGETPLWRISVPATAPALDLAGDWLIEWGGALRWLRSDAPAAAIRAAAAVAGGHATLFRGHDGKAEVFHPLPPAMIKLHQRVKESLDPHGIFNRGCMYEAF